MERSGAWAHGADVAGSGRPRLLDCLRRSEALFGGLGGQAGTDGSAEDEATTNRFDDALPSADLLDEGTLPRSDVCGAGLREQDGVTGDVADEGRVLVREVVLQFDDALTPVGGHEVEVELHVRVQADQPAIERHEVVVGAATEELEGQVEPDPLASVVGVLLGVAVDLAFLEALEEHLVPGQVDLLRDGDDQVEVPAQEVEVIRVGHLSGRTGVVVDELAELHGSRPEEVDVTRLRGEAKGARGVLQADPGVHGSDPFSL